MNEIEKRIGSVALAGAIGLGAHAEAAITAFAEEPVNTTTAIVQEDDTYYYYRVQAGDTLAEISKKFTGDPCKYPVIIVDNNICDENVIYEGDTLLIRKSICKNPVVLEPVEQQPIVVPQQEFEPDIEYEVQHGEVLNCILRKFYPEDLVWKAIPIVANYNDKDDPHLLYEGEILYIPCEAKLKTLPTRDYSKQDQMLQWRLEHPGEPYPCWITGEKEYKPGCPNWTYTPCEPTTPPIYIPSENCVKIYVYTPCE